VTTNSISPLLYDYVVQNAARDPEGDALVFNGLRWSHVALQADVDAVARAMLSRGIVKGDRVAALVAPSPPYWISFLAAASIGAIWVGLNPRYQLAELQSTIADAAPQLLIAADPNDGRDFAALLTALCQESNIPSVIADMSVIGAGSMALCDQIVGNRIVTVDELAVARRAVNPRDPVTIVYTSGSTGPAKGALLHQQGMVDFAVGQNRLWPVSAIRVLNYFPVNHIGSIVDVSVPALVGGGTMVLMDQFAPQAAMELIEREKITIWGSVPSVFKMQLELPEFDQFDLTSIELIAWGGAAMDVATIARLRDVHPRLATNYGMTETSSAITSTIPTDDLEALEFSVGRAFPGVTIKLVDSDGNEVTAGAPGEVLARSAMNFLGYWRQPLATAAAFDDDGFFKTGDLAMQRPDGAYRIVGRVKEMYKSGGYNVYPREVEAVIDGYAGVCASAVVGAADPLWQEVGVAFVVLTTPITSTELAAHCRSHLANYKVPKRFVIMDALPLLPIGKVDKRALSILATSITAPPQ
jgi:acyl-CoA synthetase (AMP-forming)/AMP-acid ligase II